MNRRVAFLLGLIVGYELGGRVMRYGLVHDPDLADDIAAKYGRNGRRR